LDVVAVAAVDVAVVVAVCVATLAPAIVEVCDVPAGLAEGFEGCGVAVAGGVAAGGTGVVPGCVTGLGAKAPAISEPSPSF